MTARRRLAPPLTAALSLAVLSLAVSACGYSSSSKDVVEGEPVELGALDYNVVFSRYLNPEDAEDSAYLVGQAPPPAGSTYFGVFFEVHNESDATQRLPSSFTIVDADRKAYESVPSESLYAFPFGGEVEAEERVPELDTTPQQGPIEGSLVLFRLPASASDNRPLTLEIPGPEGPAKVTLDL
jgi:hypothetical protein